MHQSEDFTTDSFFNGRLKVRQGRSGYRYSLDAVLLSAHAAPRAKNRVLDLGTGCGIVPLILAYCCPDIKIYGVEIQKSLADLAVRNVQENKMESRIEILCEDLKNLKPGDISGPVNLVVGNPPYRKAEAGRINPDRQKAAAKHEIHAQLQDILDTAGRMLLPRGRLVMVYTAERLADILLKMRGADIEPKFFRMIHPHINSAAKLILIEGLKEGNPGMKNAPPLIIYNKDGSYTGEVRDMFSHLSGSSGTRHGDILRD